MTIDEAAKLIGYSRHTLAFAVRKGEIAATVDHGRYVLTEEAVREWANRPRLKGKRK